MTGAWVETVIPLVSQALHWSMGVVGVEAVTTPAPVARVEPGAGELGGHRVCPEYLAHKVLMVWEEALAAMGV
jgi:hypothetical protein